MPEDEYRPRPNDHLVEPFLGGLGCEATEGADPDPPGACEDRLAPKGRFASLCGALRRLIRGLASRPAADR